MHYAAFDTPKPMTQPNATSPAGQSDIAFFKFIGSSQLPQAGSSIANPLPHFEFPKPSAALRLDFLNDTLAPLLLRPCRGAPDR
jgi:hypothetical protein